MVVADSGDARMVKTIISIVLLALASIETPMSVIEPINKTKLWIRNNFIFIFWIKFKKKTLIAQYQWLKKRTLMGIKANFLFNNKQSIFNIYLETKTNTNTNNNYDNKLIKLIYI